MKKYVIYFLLLIGSICMMSCSDDETWNPVQVSRSNLSLLIYDSDSVAITGGMPPYTLEVEKPEVATGCINKSNDLFSKITRYIVSVSLLSRAAAYL